MIAPQPSSELVRHKFSSRVVLPWNTQPGLPLIVGEAPGKTEDETGEPFHPEAEAGGLFTRLMKRVGIERERFCITNTCWQRPPGNVLYTDDGYPMPYTSEAIEYWKPYLHQLIEELRPPVIIGLGRTALEVLTGFTDIGTTRGYVHQGRIEIERLDDEWQSFDDLWDRKELHTPVLCTYHPQFLNYGNRHLSGVFIRDVLAALELAERGWMAPRLNVTPNPSPEAFRRFCEDYNPERHKLTYDIENPESRSVDEEEVLEGKREISYEIDRMSFCYDSGIGGYSVPFVEPYVGMAKRLLVSSGPKRGHNCRLHDRPRLESHDFQVNGREYDTIDMWRHLNRTLPASLAFIAPFYLSIEPWKHTAHTQPEHYSALDAIIQHEVAEGMERELRASGQWEVYERHVVDILAVTTQMSRNGLPLDQAKVEEFKRELEEKQETRLARLQELVPEDLKPVKQKQGLKRRPKDTTGCVERLYEVEPEDLAKGEEVIEQKPGCPCVVRRWAKLKPFNPNSHLQKKALIKYFGHRAKTDRKTKKESADDHTLKSLITTYIESTKEKDQVAVECYQLIRECVAISKVLGTYVKGWKPGSDGLIHAIPGIWGDMFRISWRKPNLAATVADKKEVQIASGFRKCIACLPDEVIIESDWKGMEAVLVGYFAGDEDYMRLARLGVHDYMALHMLNMPVDLSLSDGDLLDRFTWVKKNHPKIRDDAKHTVHGTNYGMTPYLMAELYEMTRQRAAYLQSFYYELYPKVRAWQKAVIQEAYDKCMLVNKWGYRMPIWDAYTWNQKRYDHIRQLWVSHRTNPSRTVVMAKKDLDIVTRITTLMSTGTEEHQAIPALCYDLGGEAKAALSFYPRDTGAAMLKEAVLALEDEHQLASRGILRATAHDAILSIAPRRDAERVAEAMEEIMQRPQERLGGLVIKVDTSYGRSWDKKAMRGKLPPMETYVQAQTPVRMQAQAQDPPAPESHHLP